MHFPKGSKRCEKNSKKLIRKCYVETPESKIDMVCASKLHYTAEIFNMVKKKKGGILVLLCKESHLEQMFQVFQVCGICCV